MCWGMSATLQLVRDDPSLERGEVGRRSFLKKCVVRASQFARVWPRPMCWGMGAALQPVRDDPL